MRTWMGWIAACLCLDAGAAVASAAEPAAGLLVSPAWVAERLDDPSLLVLHVATLQADYDRGHIPGARFLWLNALAETTPEGTLEMLPAGALERRLEELGVSDDSRIVLCHVLGDVTTAARAFVTLDRLGLADRTHILDGGLEAWKAEGRVVSTEAPKPRRGRLTPKPRADVLADLAYMSSHYRDQGVRVVDARPGGAYRGSAGTGTPRGGHIPGAVNVPYSSLIDSTGRYLPVDSLKTRFETAGVHPGDEVISYCYIGRTASPVYVAARMLGHRVRLYDGSFEQWSRRIELPVEGEPAK